MNYVEEAEDALQPKTGTSWTATVIEDYPYSFLHLQ